jgi:dihydrodipicolinate synthase/N-acetylneuraminate lyase
MFNPKENLLDQQLAVSGLEMSIAPALALAGVSAVTSIAGGIMGASQAASSNAAAKSAQKKQEEYQKEIAEATNKHNDKITQCVSLITKLQWVSGSVMLRCKIFSSLISSSSIRKVRQSVTHSLD